MKQDLMIRTWKDRGGFTLVEIMIAVFLLTVALMGLISVTVMVINGNDFSRCMTTATTLAKDKIEQLKGTSYEQMTSGTDTQQTIYTRTWTVNPATNTSPPPASTTLTVAVVWPWQGANRTVQLQTLRAR